MNENILREIKSSFRQAMNADLSNSMRAHGLKYRVNFGVPSPRIRLIAERFEPGTELATYLWNEDVRESKMLATYLFPKEEMTPELAKEWIKQIPYPEIADQATMNLFSALSFAPELIDWCFASNEKMIAYTGMRLQMRLLLQQQPLTAESTEEIIRVTQRWLPQDISYLTGASFSLLEHLMEDESAKGPILAAFASWKEDAEPLKKQAYERLTFWEE